ncbi:ER membrane protein complex subunit 1 [Monosporozyma servazzii]
MWWSNWFCVLLYTIRLASAVFTDEIDVTDWALQSIGEYACVTEDPINKSLLVVLSQLEDTSLLSLINKTTGDLVTRRVTDSRVTDIKLDETEQIMFLESEGFNTSQLSVSNNDIFIAPISIDNEHSISTLCQNQILKSDHIVIDHEKKVLQIVDPHSELTVLSTELPTNFEEVVYLNTDYAQSLEFLVSTTDSNYIYLQLVNDELVNSWFRDESLANIIDYKFINIDDHSMDSVILELQEENKFDNVLQAYQFRVMTNINRLINFVKLHNYSPGKMITDFLNLDMVQDDSNNDKRSKLQEMNDFKFGFNKLLVVTNEKGKITALDMNKQGKQVWSVHSKLSPPILTFDWNETSNQLVIFNSRGDYETWELLVPYAQPVFKKVGSFKESFPQSQCEILKVNKLTQTRNSYFVEFDGNSCSKEDGIIVSLDEVTHTDKRKQFVTTHDETTIKGHVISSNNELIPTWQINLNPGEKIVSFVNRPNTNVVNPGVVLGSREVLYKYLYPHIASYVVFNEATHKIYVNIIDTLKGEVLVSQLHDKEYVDIDYPVNLVIGENWIVYSYFSLEPIPEQKVSVIELYESLTPDERKSNPANYTNPLKQSIKPEFMARSYYFPEVINKMSISETRFDITTKAIILELENGQISFLPKLVVSARRKIESEMTADDKMEFMASPYVPAIPVNDAYIISHVRDLVFDKSSKLGSVATNLESTSIICDIGHDIFCSRIAPSGRFDVLNPNFETGKLIFSILVCLVLCFILRPYVTKRNIKALWLVHE